MPSRTKLAGVSPGCTRDEMKMVGLSNLKGLVVGSPCASGNNPSINASLSSIIFVLSEKVIISIGLRSLL